MSKSWANPTWFFFHTLIEKIHPDQYSIIKNELLGQIKNICSILPCPDCANHATEYMKQIKQPPPDKEGFKRMLYQFHNTVNVMTKKQLFRYEEMEMYSRVNLTVCYSLFRREFVKKTYNPKMLMDSMNRTSYIKKLDIWMIQNKLLNVHVSQHVAPATLPS
jgi:hypothetical protein